MGSVENTGKEPQLSGVDSVQPETVLLVQLLPVLGVRRQAWSVLFSFRQRSGLALEGLLILWRVVLLPVITSTEP